MTCPSPKYLAVSAASGCVWGAIALLLAGPWMPNAVWGGVIASPLIGVAVGLAYRLVHRWSTPVQAVYAMLMLYLAVGAFGIAAGSYDALALNLPHRSGWGVVVQSVLGCWWGVTFTFYFAFLWPASMVNHAILYRFARDGSRGG